MKKILYAFLILALALPAVGQSSTPICSEVSLKGRVLTFVLTLPEGTLSGDEILKVTPSVMTRRGELKMRPLLFVGKGQFPYYRRARALQDHKTYIRQIPHAYTVVEPGKDAVLSYKRFVPGCTRELILHYEVLDCCNVRTLEEERIAISQKSTCSGKCRPSFQVSEEMVSPFIVAAREAQKVRSESIEAHFHYLFDRDLLLKDFRQNAAEIARVRDAMDHLFSDRDMYTILSGEIIGYASPEGPVGHNQDLSQRRAQSVKKYFSEFYPEMERFGVIGKGDNWEGLQKALEAPAYAAHRAELLRLVERQDKAGLKAHSCYPDLLANVYPLLRLSLLSVTYSPRGVTLEEAKRLLFEHPKDLSLEECYGAVEALAAEGKSTLELHSQVLKGHPEDPIARINYSGVALLAGKIDEAYDALRGLEEDDRACNNLGLIHAVRGDYKTARTFFEKSSDPVAKENLRRLAGR